MRLLTRPALRLFALSLFATWAATAGRCSAADEPSLERLRELQDSIPAVVEKTMPAVVAISDGSGFGSGVVVDPSGLILTAGHVVSTGVKEFEVFFPSGQSARAELLGYNLDVDAAMIQIKEPGQWPSVEIGRKDSLHLGDWTICLGHSGGYELGRKPPVRTGRILEFRDEMLVTDATLIGGDSGGPLFDTNGRLVGIHSSIGEIISENRHVSIDIFQRDWDRLKRGDRWGKLPELEGDLDDESHDSHQPPADQRAKLGVRMAQNASQAVIAEVYAGSPAQRVGMKAGDIVELFDNVAVKNGEHLIELIKRKKVGSSAKIKIRRGQNIFQLEVILDQFQP